MEYLSPEGKICVQKSVVLHACTYVCVQSCQYYFTHCVLRTGLRVDGRRPPELRKLQCKLGVFHQADGSAFLEQGNTKVLATVYGPHDVRAFVFH